MPVACKSSIPDVPGISAYPINPRPSNIFCKSARPRIRGGKIRPACENTMLTPMSLFEPRFFQQDVFAAPRN